MPRVVFGDAVGISLVDDLNLRKEQFSDAYLRAVASVAGFGATKPIPDPGIDWNLHVLGEDGTSKSPRLDVQLKCTATAVPDDGDIGYELKRKHYDKLIRDKWDITVPRILVVVFVPDAIECWLEQSEERLAMKHCGFWMSLRGKGRVENASSVTVRLPRSQLFTPEALGSIMRGIGEGDWP